METIKYLETGELRCHGTNEYGAQCGTPATSEMGFCAVHASGGFRDVPRFSIVSDPADRLF